MPKKDPRVDAYIAKAADFAQPVLVHLRKVVHAACPDAQEAIKWGVPHFLHHGMLCGMAAFKKHCAFFVWNRALADEWKKLGISKDARKRMYRFTRIGELPKAATLKKLIKKAAELNAAGVKGPPRGKPKAKKPLVVPPDLKSALAKSKKAGATFEAFSYTNKKEYIQWITDAKRPETRAERLKTAIEWMAQGKPRNWKYQNR
jgi:uncharacterized protein YdeI (YjbR/CyaY-like superfamily)